MINELLFLYRTIADLAPRVRNKMRRLSGQIPEFSSSEDKSDSQSTFYSTAVLKMNQSHEEFQKFRRVYNYREILEHVTPRIGNKYLNIMKKDLKSGVEKFSHIKSLDSVGKPYRYFYKGIGFVSPTSIRYAFVYEMLEKYFPKEINGAIAEIGVGFGGQAAYVMKMNNPRSYSMFDLPEVLELTKRYLSELDINEKVEFLNLGEITNKSWDLAISNYAFSELPSALQLEYLEKVLKKSHSGFMIMNSGRTNLTGRSEGKLTLDQIVGHLTDVIIVEETPKTSDDNYILIWGSENQKVT